MDHSVPDQSGHISAEGVQTTLTVSAQIDAMFNRVQDQLRDVIDRLLDQDTGLREAQLRALDKAGDVQIAAIEARRDYSLAVIETLGRHMPLLFNKREFMDRLTLNAIALNSNFNPQNQLSPILPAHLIPWQLSMPHQPLPAPTIAGLPAAQQSVLPDMIAMEPEQKLSCLQGLSRWLEKLQV